MTISIIAAVGENNVIGKNNELIWRLPADLKYFKQLTSGHSIIMGRKTFESIGKALPGRTNIIITRNQEFAAAGCSTAPSLEHALTHAKQKGEQEAFIIGGGEIYRQALAVANKIYLTKVFAVFEGDTFFPSLLASEWKQIQYEEHQPDQKNKYKYAFCTYVRN